MTLKIPTGPVCLHSPDEYGFECAVVNGVRPDLTYKNANDPFFVPYKDAGDYVCRPSEYEKRMMEFVKRIMLNCSR